MPISESKKHQGNVLGCHSTDKLEHLPIKKRRFLFKSPSTPPKIPSVKEENPNFIRSQDDPVQSPVACPVSSKSELGITSVDKADVQSNSPKKVNENLESAEDFTGISILAAAACTSSLVRGVGFAEDGSGVEEASAHECPVEASTNSEARSLSKVLEKKEFVNVSDTSIGGAISCVTTTVVGEFTSISTAEHTSEKMNNLEKSVKDPSHEDGTPTVSSSTRDEDGPQKLQSRDDRLHWDLNVVMDAWEEPLEFKDVHSSDHLSQSSGIAVGCDANIKSAEDHDLQNEPEGSTCDDKMLLHYEPKKLPDQISQGNMSQVYGFNHKNQIVSTCGMSVSSHCRNVSSSLGHGNNSVQPFLSKYVHENPPVLESFDIKKHTDNVPSGECTKDIRKHADNVPSGECTNFDVAASLCIDQKNLFVPVVDTHVRFAVPQPLSIENELTLKSTMSAKCYDDRSQSLKNDGSCADRVTTIQVNNAATMEKKNYSFPMNGSSQADVDVHDSVKEIKISSTEYLEEKLMFDAPSDPCSTHEIEVAGKLQDDYDSRYEDGELREPNEHAWEEYDAINEKIEHNDSESAQIRTIKCRDACNADPISSASGIANELYHVSDRPTAGDNDQGEDDSLLKLFHSGDEKLKDPASSEMLESNKVPSPTVVKVRDDCDEKGGMYYHPTTRSVDPDGTNSTLYRRGLLSQIEGPVRHDISFREDQVVNISKLDGVNRRWDRGSSYIKSNERVEYSFQSRPRIHQGNSWDRSSDVRRGIKRDYSPIYHPHAKPDDDNDTASKEDIDGTLNTSSYLSPSTNDDSIADVDAAGNFRMSHKPHGAHLGSDRRLMSRGRFVRYGRQMDNGAGRGRYHGPSTDDTFQASLKYRRPLSQMDRSFSPTKRRGYPFPPQSHSRSPSRSRTRSPDTRVSPRGRSAAADCGGLYLRHKSRSPNFKSDARMPRMRSPPHQRFGADRMTGSRPFLSDGSPPSRWNSNRKDEPGHINYKQRPILDRSPSRIRQRGDKKDHFDSARNPRPDPYYRQNTGRFSEMDATGRPHRLDENFDNRRRQFAPIHSRRGYEDDIVKRVHHNDDAFVSTSNRDVPEFHGRGTRDVDNRNEDMPRRFRRDSSFMYEQDRKFSSNSKQFGFGGIESSRNLKGGEPYRSINPGRFREMDGAGRGNRYMDSHDERRRQYGGVYLPRRGEMEGIGRRISHDVNENLPDPQVSCIEDTDSHARNASGIDGYTDDLSTEEREEQHLVLSGPEMKLSGTSKSTDVEVPVER